MTFVKGDRNLNMAVSIPTAGIKVARVISVLSAISLFWSESFSSVLINEVNSDSPRMTEVTEYVELWNTDHCGVSLDGYRLAFYTVIDGTTSLYRDMGLTNFCISGNGHFLLGSNVLPVQADLEITDPNFIQNGNGVADAIVLYTNEFGSEPHVWEDSNFLSEDESISRCRDEPNKLSAFMTTSLTPGAPNLCQPDRLSRWPSPCRGVRFPDVNRQRSFQFQINRGFQGIIRPILSLRVASFIACSSECSQQDLCTHLSYSHTTTQTHNCLLHDFCSVYQTASADWLIAEKFYKQSPRNPVWPHDVPM